MNFNEKLISLRKSKGLSQEELGAELNVTRQTISKWESCQSYPDFQRLVLLSDFFGLTLDELVKDIDVQEVREKNLNSERLNSIYSDVENAKKIINLIKESKLKVQAQIQDDQVRVSGKNKDDLQQVIAKLRQADLEIDLQFINFR